jgi:hypothetical protein
VPDDRDGYIDIDIDEEDDSGADEAVLDVRFDEPAASPPPGGAPPPRARRPAVAGTPPPAEEPALPMIATGVCPRCGYALRPLEEVCPRCHSRVTAPVEKPVEKQAIEPEIASEAPLPPVGAQYSPHRGSTLFTIAGVILFVALAVGIPLYIWMQPVQRANREYQAGLRAQLAGDFEQARRHYRIALELNPQFGLAAFSMGTTYLRIGDPAIVQSIQPVVQSAVQGQTQELDEADRWFEQAATIGQGLPPSTRLMDARINSPARLRAFARACLALTALIRASAAIQADHLEDGMGWLQVAGQQAQAAVGDDPGNQTANQVLRSAGSMGGPQVAP